MALRTRQPIRFVAAVVLAIWSVHAGLMSAGAAEAGQRRAVVGVVLSNLPPHATPEYDSLKALAHTEGGQMLEMTKSEMWSVPRDHLEALRASAAKSGVVLKELDQTWNHLLAPMAAGSEMSPKQSEMMHQTMQSKAAMGMSMMALPQSSVIEYALTKGMAKGMNETAETRPRASLVIPLKDGMMVEVRRQSVTKTKDGYIWHGTVRETGEPATLLWWPGGRLSGSITYRGHVFSVKNMGGVMHAVVEVSPNDLPPEHAPMDNTAGQKTNVKDDPLVSKGDASLMRPAAERGMTPVPEEVQQPLEKIKNLEDAAQSAAVEGQKRLALTVPKPSKSATKLQDVTITLVVAFTKQAASHFDNIETDLIAPAVEDTNQSFRNSGIGHIHIELVHAYQTDYVETGSHFDHVYRFSGKGDGYMDEIHDIRDRVQADVAVLVVHDPQGCGLAAGVAPKEDRAFAVVHHECAATSYSIAHEIGHIIGARHDAGLDDSVAPYPYGHGFVHGKDWRTMMSYKESCDGCPRLPLWSSPAIKVHGVPAGDEKSNNARVISEGAARVAGFR